MTAARAETAAVAPRRERHPSLECTMTLRAKFGWTIAAVSVIVNAGGAVYALLRQEWMHGGTHAALLALTLYLIVLLRPGARRTAPDISAIDDESPQSASLGDARMEQLQQ